MTQINSDTLIAIEQNFRVSAGPGAGKTHWLINHIKNVLHHSTRLGKTKKIACITYTNIAVEILLRRLGTSANQVEVSTIHSFLYKHVVKPYALFIPADYRLNVKAMDGHDDTILSSYPFLSKWKEKTNQSWITENDKVIEAFKAAKWKFDDSDTLDIIPDPRIRLEKYAIKRDSYLEYKKMTWEIGVIHHDDVLFFGYQLIRKFPFILQVLRAKFPYFFVDEFQDTNPIQARILKQIGREETIVGVIGDYAQSIYDFQGADPIQFSSFTLPNLVDYQIADNRRSTNQIIDLLNTIRSKDIQQNKFRNKEGERPTIIVGEMDTALHKAKQLCKNEEVYSLSRDNITANAMKKDMNKNIPSDDLLKILYDTDSNRERGRLILACIKASELAYEKRFKESIKEMERVFKNENDRDKRKKEALKYIYLLLEKYDNYKHKTLYEFYLMVREEIDLDISIISNKGKIREFYENHTYQQLAICVKIAEDTCLHRTVHKAKGDEFDNVLLVLKSKKEAEVDLSFLLKPNLEKNQEHRIIYVAMSRAKERLFISLPSLSEPNRNRLSNLFSIIEAA